MSAHRANCWRAFTASEAALPVIPRRHMTQPLAPQRLQGGASPRSRSPRGPWWSRSHRRHSSTPTAEAASSGRRHRCPFGRNSGRQPAPPAASTCAVGPVSVSFRRVIAGPCRATYSPSPLARFAGQLQQELSPRDSALPLFVPPKWARAKRPPQPPRLSSLAPAVTSADLTHLSTLPKMYPTDGPPSTPRWRECVSGQCRTPRLRPASKGRLRSSRPCTSGQSQGTPDPRGYGLPPS